MSASGAARRGRALSIHSVSRANSEINVTPLVDVVLVLLIIFMVVTPLLERDIGVQIPATEKADEPQDVPPDQVVVRIDASGGIALNGAPTTLEGLGDAIRPRFAGRGRKVVFVAASDEAPYPRLVQVLDVARRAGAETLGMTASDDALR